jgi:hypothetical protein
VLKKGRKDGVGYSKETENPNGIAGGRETGGADVGLIDVVN